jgi:protein-tyrosine-phosphatase
MRDADRRNVLFLCTGNSARSILAEVILNTQSGGRYRAYSAGSHPAGKVNPWALRLLEQKGLPTGGLRSKSWDEFARPGAPPMHFVFTVCDNAANETCPVWPGAPIAAHWGIEDPAASQGDDLVKMQAFRTAYAQMERRVQLFLALPMASLRGAELKRALDDIGRCELPATS